MQRIITLISLLALSFFLTKAYALKSDYTKPINVVSKEQVADLKKNKVIFDGAVHVTQGSMEIKADRIEVLRGKDGKLSSIKAYGSPVTFKQKLDTGKIFHTRSSTLSYLPKDTMIVLEGKASIWQGESRMEGERIEYNIQTQKMRAHNKKTQGGRVSSTFIPAQLKEQSNK